jgi:eukaryotic-like serine/threonine-protein kinase
MDVGPSVLADRYELVSPLARGGMGQVWRARDRLLGRAVAVKILRSEFTEDEGFRARFRAEAQHAAMIVHPHIASVFDYGEVAAAGTGEPLAYLVMELVEGESLAHLLRRERRLSPELTLSILRQTAAALAAAHAAGIVHRDVKPGNVLVAPDGTVKITDFGVAWSASSVALTGTGQVIGTAHYLSPEQAQGAKATPASDVYALGAVAYECLAGRRAFEGENSVQIALKQIRDEPDPLPADVPADLRAVVERALVKDPAVRYGDGAELQAAVERVTLAPQHDSRTGTAVLPLPLGAMAAADPVTAPTERIAGPAERPAGRHRRRAALWVALGAALTVLAVVLGLSALGNEDPAAGTAPAPTTSSAPPSSTSPAPPTTVTVAADGLVGRPVEEVRAELQARGLTVQVTPVTTAEVPEGQVTAVEPGGAVPVGGTVTVSYAVAPPPAPEPEPAPEPAPEPPAEDGGGGDEEADEEEADEDEPGNGNGNGRGNGKGKDKKDD